MRELATYYRARELRDALRQAKAQMRDAIHDGTDPAPARDRVQRIAAELARRAARGQQSRDRAGVEAA